MIPQHLSLTQEHYTPTHVTDAARRVMGGIDLDPASCGEANRAVQAARWIGLPRDGLDEKWGGRVFLNPPGGRTPKKWKVRYGTNSNATAWWRRLVEDVSMGNVTQAIFVGFTLEILRTSQGDPRWLSALRFPICVPRERLCFGGDDPTHANVIVYIGQNEIAFGHEFSSIGEVRL